jgi:ethanolamine permease
MIVVALYICVVLCVAEITSIVAFAGGGYGFVRCSLSPFLGFLVGSSEWITYNFFTICSILPIAEALTHAFQTDRAWEPFYLFASYVAVVAWHTRGGRYFWYTMCICGAMSLALILVFILMSLTGNKSFFHGSSLNSPYRGYLNGSYGVFRDLIHPMYIFIGLDTIIIAGAKLNNVR